MQLELLLIYCKMDNWVKIASNLSLESALEYIFVLRICSFLNCVDYLKGFPMDGLQEKKKK